MRQPKPSEPKHLTASQAAAPLQVSPKTVSRWAKEGKLPFVRTLGATGGTRTARSGRWSTACRSGRRPTGPEPGSRSAGKRPTARQAGGR